MRDYSGINTHILQTWMANYHVVVPLFCTYDQLKELSEAVARESPAGDATDSQDFSLTIPKESQGIRLIRSVDSCDGEKVMGFFTAFNIGIHTRGKCNERLIRRYVEQYGGHPWVANGLCESVVRAFVRKRSLDVKVEGIASCHVVYDVDAGGGTVARLVVPPRRLCMSADFYYSDLITVLCDMVSREFLLTRKRFVNEDGLYMCSELASLRLCSRMGIEKMLTPVCVRQWTQKMESKEKLYKVAAGLSYKICNRITDAYNDTNLPVLEVAFFGAVNRISRCENEGACRCFGQSVDTSLFHGHRSDLFLPPEVVSRISNMAFSSLRFFPKSYSEGNSKRGLTNRDRTWLKRAIDY